MSDRKLRGVDQGEFVISPERQPTRVAGRIAVFMVLIFAALLVTRIIAVQCGRGSENTSDRGDERKQQIVHWVEQNFGNPEAKIVGYGGLRGDLFKSEKSLEVMVGQLNKPAEDQFCICRFTFDRSGKVLSVSRRPVR
jgi:hypothetical protein